MKKLLTGLLLAAAMLTPMGAYGQEPATAPKVEASTRTAAAPADLAETIKKAIELLEADKNKEAIELLAPPAVVKKETVEKMLPKFEKRSKLLLTALKEAQSQTPTLSGDDRAMYPRSEDDKERPPLRFQKIEGKWYLK